MSTPGLNFLRRSDGVIRNGRRSSTQRMTQGKNRIASNHRVGMRCSAKTPVVERPDASVPRRSLAVPVLGRSVVVAARDSLYMVERCTAGLSGGHTRVNAEAAA